MGHCRDMIFVLRTLHTVQRGRAKGAVTEVMAEVTQWEKHNFPECDVKQARGA